MREFKIEKQQTKIDSCETTLPIINTIHIKADNYKLIRDEINITEGNLEMAKEINSTYEIGNIHYGPLTIVEFYTLNSLTPSYIGFNILADPYFKLFEKIKNKWVKIK